MPKRYSPLNTLAADEERFISRAVAQERAQMDALYEATAGPGMGETQRSQRIGNELLAKGDPATVERVRRYQDFMSPAEREQLNRRVERAGGQRIFDDTGTGR